MTTKLYEAAEWQTIETAPKDGELFLITNGKNFEVANQPNNCALGKWIKGSDRRWYGAATISFNPTHWMPLPKPPK